MTPVPSLRGGWRKIAGGECARAYPASLEFEEARILGTKDPATQGFIIWDAGNYRVESNDTVMIQTASDEQVRYRYRLADDLLTFIDANGCEFSYERT